MTTQPAIVETLLWLCQIPSFIGEEGPLSRAVEERLVKAVTPSSIRRYGESIVIPVTRATGGPKIALVGHLDVVRTSHDAPPRIEGDRLYGAGAADMKSGLAAMIDLVENDAGAFASVDLTLVFYAREEGPYLENELGPVLDADPDLAHVDLAVCLEPSDNKLSLGASGSIHATITFEGKTSHSARPWQGINAIHKAGAFLAELDAIKPREVELDGLVYRSVFSITGAEGGRARNIVPDKFELNLNHRFAPDKTLDEAKMDVIALVKDRAKVEFTDLSPAAPPRANHPLVVALKDAGVVAVEPKQAWTDVARFAAIGVAAVNFGPGDNAEAHQRNESTSIAKLLQGQVILSRWLRSVRK